jgi:hypothetical protein
MFPAYSASAFSKEPQKFRPHLNVFDLFLLFTRSYLIRFLVKCLIKSVIFITIQMHFLSFSHSLACSFTLSLTHSLTLTHTHTYTHTGTLYKMFLYMEAEYKFHNIIEHRYRMVSIHASYSGGHGFKFRPKNRPSC